MTRLEHALALARQGLFIFPLSPGSKVPYANESWKEMMTFNEATIRGWFAARPNMNYGVCPGPNGLIVDLDHDPARDKDGIGSLTDLESGVDFEEWIKGVTFEVRTPRGGLHLYLLAPRAVANSAGTFAPGIDIRGEGGYVVGPGSHTDEDLPRHTAEGTYEVVTNQPIMRAPQWVMTRISETLLRSDDADTPLYEYDTGDSIEHARELIRQQTEWPTEGQGGDNATYQFVCLVRDCCVSPETALELLTEAFGDDQQSWNERCLPPWNIGELEYKIRNAYRYGKNQPGTKGGLIAMAGDAVSQAMADGQIAADKERFGRLEAITFRGQAFSDRESHREMIVPEWLPAKGMTQVLARRGVGKSVALLDLSLRIVNDMDFYGYPIAEGWSVLYLCGEDDDGLQEHMRAWLQVHKKDIDPSRFIVVTGVPNLMNADDVATWAEFLKLKIGDRKCLTVVDTWQRATSRASQNDDKEMALAVENAENLGKALGGPIAMAVHPPKHNATTISGSQIIENTGVAIWVMTKMDDNYQRELKVTRIKGKGESNYLNLGFDEIKFGEHDQFGRERTGIVMSLKGGSTIGETPEAKTMKLNAKAIYASIITEIIIAKRNVAEKLTDSDFSVRSIAEDVSKLVLKDNRYKGMLATAQNMAFASPEKTRKFLLDVFRDGQPWPTISGNFEVKLVKKSSTLFIFIMDEAAKRAESHLSPEDARMMREMDF